MNIGDIDRLDTITAHIHNLLQGGQPPLLDLAGQPNDEITQVAEFVNRLILALDGLAAASSDLSNGLIDTDIQGRLAASHSLKNLQATLRHLTWQTNQIAKGDFSQRVDFLGDFSLAFNSMVQQLDDSRQQILAQNKELKRLATTDVLTEIYNRRFFMAAGSNELLRSQRYRHEFSIILMDIDHFKKINDTHGHDVGDEVLKAMTAGCAATLRENDIFARMGGEEFALMLPETGLAAALHVAERLREIVAALKVFVGAQVVHFTMSCGVSLYRHEDKAMEDVLKRADNALYLAKNGGRNRVCSENT